MVLLLMMLLIIKRITTTSVPSIAMVLSDAGCKRKAQEAVGVIAAANGKVKILSAMQLVGFLMPDCRNLTTYQQG